VSAPRDRRELVPFEALAVVALALMPFGDVPVALPLFAVASCSLYLRGRSWAELAMRGSLDRALIGAAAGGVALALAIVVGTPGLEALGAWPIEWSRFPIVRGNAAAAGVVILTAAATALAMELALRGWIVERVLELWPGSPGLPVLVGALAEALLTPREPAARLGAAVFGAGLGWMYCAAGRSIVAPLLARIVFQAGAVALEALRVIG
jgi:membrane protease YdiL (CAAX protease family)